jgi:hypothetical protein
MFEENGKSKNKTKKKTIQGYITAMPNAVKRTKRDESLDDVIFQIWMFNKDGALAMV